MIEQIITSQEIQQSKSDLDFFKPYDLRFVTTDSAPRDIVGSTTTHFDQKTGWLYYAKTVVSGFNKVRIINAFNLRIGEYYRFSDKDKNPREDSDLLEAILRLDPEFQEWYHSPPGNFEVAELIDLCMQTNPIKIENILDEVLPGDYILFQDYSHNLQACCVGKIAPLTKPGQEGVRSIHTQAGMESLDILPYNYQCRMKQREPRSTYVGSMYPTEHEFNLSGKVQSAWKISEATYLQLKNYAEIGYDPSIEAPLSREEYTICVCWDGMAFDRWGASIASIRDSNPERYQNCTKKNLEKAIELLVTRFGAEAFTKSLQALLFEHAKRLHTPLQRTNLMLAQNNAFGDVHSDIIGFDSKISTLAKEVIGDIHPIVADMEKDGHGRVYQGVYNAKSLLGDYELFEILIEKYPDIFQQLVRSIISLPSINQGDWYGNSIVNPLAAVKEYFPEVFKLFSEKYEGDIPDITEPALKLNSEEA